MIDDRTPKPIEPDDGEPLPEGAAAVLATWATSEPAPGFADRVIAAARHRGATRPALRRRSIGAVLAAVLAAAAVVVLLRGTPSSPTAARADGARVVQDRETIALGARAVAVAEGGAERTWTIAATGAAEVHQTTGDVFYRVDGGAPFVVATPYGQVIVRGTCFRVEVLNMSVSRQSWIGGVAGAALAATIVVTVYEGRIRVVNARGQADARAGDRIALAAGAAPTRLDGAAQGIAALEPPPPASASVPDLLRRDQSHRGEIAMLRARVRTLESSATADPTAVVASPHRDGNRKIVDLSPAELADMAKSCEIRYDLPGYGIEPRLMTDKLAALDELSGDDRAMFDRTVRTESAGFMAALRALYHELVGEPGDNLDARALKMELLEKSPASDVEAARKRLAAERAGLAAAPADGRNQSVVERLFRLEISAGGALEQLLAAELGADKAHRIRTAGWPGGDDNILSGCPD